MGQTETRWNGILFLKKLNIKEKITDCIEVLSESARKKSIEFLFPYLMKWSFR